jgi:hypothetical protein
VWVSAGKATIQRTAMQHNGLAGLVVNGANANVSVGNSNMTNNTYGIEAGTGAGSATGSIINVYGCVIGENTTGVSLEGATVQSLGNNSIRGNTTDIAGGSLVTVSQQ